MSNYSMCSLIQCNDTIPGRLIMVRCHGNHRLSQSWWLAKNCVKHVSRSPAFSSVYFNKLESLMSSKLISPLWDLGWFPLQKATLDDNLSVLSVGLHSDRSEFVFLQWCQIVSLTVNRLVDKVDTVHLAQALSRHIWQLGELVLKPPPSQILREEISINHHRLLY